MSDFSIDFILNRAGAQFAGTNTSMGLIQRLQLQAAAMACCQPYAVRSAPAQHPCANAVEGPHHHHAARLAIQEPSSSSAPSLAVPTLMNGVSGPMYDWLQYTRYHPPKLPRALRQGPAKRTPGRLPRIPFTPAQLDSLERSYRQSNYLSAEDANKLAESLDLTSIRVKIWFQNRRARERREVRGDDHNGLAADRNLEIAVDNDESSHAAMSSDVSTASLSPVTTSPSRLERRVGGVTNDESEIETIVIT